MNKELFDKVFEELKTHKKRYYIDTLLDIGNVAIIYEALENMYYHGKLMYPETYKHRKTLSKYVKNYVKEQSKRWEKTM